MSYIKKIIFYLLVFISTFYFTVTARADDMNMPSPTEWINNFSSKDNTVICEDAQPNSQKVWYRYTAKSPSATGSGHLCVIKYYNPTNNYTTYYCLSDTEYSLNERNEWGNEGNPSYVGSYLKFGNGTFFDTSSSYFAYFNGLYTYLLTTNNNIVSDNFDYEVTEKPTYETFYNILNDNNWGNSSDSANLPNLNYSYKRKSYFAPSIPLTRFTGVISWNYEDIEPYSSDSANYYYQAFYNLGEKNFDINSMTKLDLGSVATNECSFRLYDLYKTVLPNGPQKEGDGTLNVYIRTITTDGSKWSNWYWRKMDFTSAGGGGQSTDGGYYEPDGDEIEPDKPGVDDIISKPGSDDHTTAEDYEEGSLYNPNNKVDPKSVLDTLKGIVSSLGEIPSLIAMVFGWLPSSIISLIGASVGLIVIIGIVKLIVK